jgi:trimethylamine---corrinoid protein Co-methyltransferase
MKSGKYQVLSESEIRTIHEHSMRVLSETGIRVVVKKMRGILRDIGCTVDEETKIVKFPPHVVEQYRKKAPREFVMCGCDPSFERLISPDTRVYSGLSTAINMYDLETGEYRPSTLKDVVDHIVLIDYMDNVHTNQMDIWPNDIPMQTIHVETMRQWALNCKKPYTLGSYGVMATTDMMHMLSLIMGGMDTIKKKHPFNAIISVQSPLSTAHLQVEGLMIMAQNGQPCIMAPEAMAGTTAPVTLAGLLVQHNAEIIAHVVMAQAVNAGAPVFYGTVSTIAEMRRGTVALGAIETGMISAASAQMANFYDLPCRAVAGCTESKTIDVQCGTERAQSIMLAAMGGANYITCVGTLESSTAAAHELTVIDNEIIGMVERALRGIEVNENSMALDVIQNVGPDGNYLMQEHTQRNFRTEHFIPKLADREKRDIWEKGGKRDMAVRAREEAKKILAKHKLKDIDRKLAKELDDFVKSVAARSLDEFYAAEWEA